MERYNAKALYKEHTSILAQGMIGDFEVVLAADAQATIAALQAKLEDLTAKYQNLVAWYDKQNGTPCEQVRHRQEVEALQARVQELEQWVQDQSTANLETMRHTDEMQSRALEAEQQLTQRTAELEAAQADRDRLKGHYERAYGRASNAEALVADLQAELERVRAALLAIQKSCNAHDEYSSWLLSITHNALQHRQGMEG